MRSRFRRAIAAASVTVALAGGLAGCTAEPEGATVRAAAEVLRGGAWIGALIWRVTCHGCVETGRPWARWACPRAR